MAVLQTLLKKGLNDIAYSQEELETLFSIPIGTQDYFTLLNNSYQKSQQSSNHNSEVHAQIGLDVGPCNMQCGFCSFAEKNKIFTKPNLLSKEEVLKKTKEFQQAEADAIYLMATANYSFETYLEMAESVKKILKKDVPLIANIRDITAKEAHALKEVGFTGAYHAVRLGEGKDTNITIKKRLQTFQHLKEVNLQIGTCLEPAGPEHNPLELAQKTLIMRDAQPVYGGAARRISIPNGALEHHGMMSKAELAKLVAVTRLALPKTVAGTCTHEPNLISCLAGANLLWAEQGTNPRDAKTKTEEGRGLDVSYCRTMLHDAGWKNRQKNHTFFKIN